MFTGLVEELGTFRAVTRSAKIATIAVSARRVLEELEIGDSVALNGVCLTVTTRSESGFTCEAVPETLERSSLGQARAGDRVNLERSLRLGQRLGGHLVQGHVDAVGQLMARGQQEDSLLLTISIPPAVSPYLVPKGSVAVDGVSLTVASLDPASFAVAVIPLTAQTTTLGRKQVGDPVNLEGDILGKYVERLLKVPGKGPTGPSRDSGLNKDFLQRHGWF